jgi:8-oxo-dGTP pyrophosphatase MutT (NUDIX family)
MPVHGGVRNATGYPKKMAQPDAAVAIVRAARPLDCLLLMRRTERESDSWSGHWSFPGGRREPADADPLDTALRELREECGLTLSGDAMVEARPHAVARRRVPPFLLVAPFVFRIEEQLPVVPDPREAAEAAWIPMATLSDPSRHCLRPIPWMAADMRYPAVDLNGGPLWGFTYRLITDWLCLAPKTPEAGFEAAYDVLQFLELHGLTIVDGWAPAGARVKARVRGDIPARDLLDHFSRPEQFRPAINRLQALPSRVSIVGPAFEEYEIDSVGP